MAPGGKETEEEYDARLEREENERNDAKRKEDLRRVKEKLELEAQSSGGIRYKGEHGFLCSLKSHSSSAQGEAQ